MADNHLLTEEVRITAVERGRIWVETIRCQDCATCATGEGCRNSKLFRIFAPQRQEFPLPVKSSRNYKIGNRLEVSFSQYALVVASMAAYMVPLFFLLVLTGIGHYVLGLGEPYLLGFILSGACLVLLLFRHIKLYPLWRRLFIPQLKKLR